MDSHLVCIARASLCASLLMVAMTAPLHAQEVEDAAPENEPVVDQSAKPEPLAEGKASLAAGDFPRAIVLFSRAAADGSAEARELLGFAHEKAGQLAHAKSQYQAYLKAFPAGADAERVRQRLNGVLAALETEAEAEFAARKSARLDSTQPAKSPAVARTRDAAKGDLEPADKGWNWDASGSIGLGYSRNDGFEGNLLRGSIDDHDIRRNEFVSTGDLIVNGQKGPNEIVARVSSAATTPLLYDDQELSLSTAYVEMRNKLNGLSARAGRQNRVAGGVFGLFDGVNLGYQATDRILLQVVAGSPVYYDHYEPFGEGRYFVGASADLTSADGMWTGSLYAIEQQANSKVDRRAVGTEVRYNSSALTSYAGLDFDVYYGEINNAYVSATWNPFAELSVYAGLDYRRVPFLLTSNALLGQPVGSLSELFDIYGTNRVETLAVDRTATAATATLGFTYALSDDWTVSLEGTLANYSGTPASGGVGSVPSPGLEYYIWGRVDGSNVFTEGDYAGFGLTAVENETYRSYIADAVLRYPLSDLWRLSPQFRLAYRTGNDTDLRQLLLMPSLALSYDVTSHWTIAGEAGVLWEEQSLRDEQTSNVDLRLGLGVRYSF